MQTDAQIELPESAAAPAARAEATPERISRAAWALLTGLAIGYAGSVLFLNTLIGISYPLFILLLVLAAALAARRAGVSLRPRNLWLALPALFFAAMVALRAQSSLRDANMLLALAFGALWLYFLPSRQRFDEATVSEYAASIAHISINTLSAPARELGYVPEWLRSRGSARSRTALAVVRGVLLAIPVLLVFAVLLSTADAVFSRALHDFGEALGFGRTDILRQVSWIALFGWFGSGVAAQAMRGVPDPSTPVEAQDRPAAHPKRQPFTLSIIEAGIVLGGVNLMFIVFVLIQFRYFFGGDANIAVEGLTYAEYARRGFFELVAVAVLTLVLVLALDWVTVRSGACQHRLFRGLALVLVALVGVMMFSASQRMNLYQDAYGYTPLRVYVSVLIPWLALLFGFFVLTLMRARERIFSIGALVCAIGFGAHINLMNVEGTIAQRNIDRYRAGEALDGALLWGFSVDAFEPMWALYRNEDVPGEVRGFAANWLYTRYQVLMQQHQGAGSTIFSAHWARDQAYARLSSSEFATGMPVFSDTGSGSWYFEGRGTGGR
jgi:hypothetical protein